ncbi:DeoR/GlpR family DNA-binding transcription regulator [Brooklawnia sp.]|uniref:DeoR/GlpR family DNA-binding transcription regulator n=1 Tax=Brooklawnia sp. TaxID=2699740 RepID=UPI00311D3AF8
MYAPERQAVIASRTRSDGRVDVASLAQELDVTAETIRRDLTALERRGILRRVHGGAVAVERVAIEQSFQERESANAEAKKSIARAALAQIGDASSIVIDGGTTTALLAAMLPTDRELTVITHALPVATLVAMRPNINLHLVGGNVRGRTLVSVGPWAINSLASIRADIAVMGTNGLTLEFGMTTPDISEAEVKRALARAARRLIVLADHTKIGRDELITVVPLEAIDTLVTDAAVDPELAADLASTGLTVVYA